MKIGYVVNTYPSPSHSFIRREIRALERRGLSITRLAMRPHPGALGDPADIEEDAATEHVLAQGALALLAALLGAALGAPSRFVSALGLAMRAGRAVPGGRLRHLVYLAEGAWLARRARALGLARLHAHFGTNSAAVAMLAHALGGPPYSFTVHGPEEFDRPEAIALGLKLARADFAVAISSFGRSQLSRWVAPRHWKRLHVVHCGIEPGHYAEPAPLPPPQPLRLVNIGRFAEQKGQLLLIEALAEAVRRGVDLQLTLLGDGPLRPQIEAAIAASGLESRVTLAGWLDEAGVRGAIDDSHALVLPSFAEGLPMVVMEAMAAARPVIATWVAGIPELMRHGRTGWLVPAGDAEALCDAICELSVAGPEKLARMGRSGRARALTRHDIDASAEKLAALFAQRPRAQPG
ncbi:MAG: glycosyltransferase family 4 protein [Pararhodobacter sp.]|nr:glycosyltransferase family 4 protein [Pararhodobacter sp.]